MIKVEGDKYWKKFWQDRFSLKVYGEIVWNSIDGFWGVGRYVKG